MNKLKSRRMKEDGLETPPARIFISRAIRKEIKMKEAMTSSVTAKFMRVKLEGRSRILTPIVRIIRLKPLLFIKKNEFLAVPNEHNSFYLCQTKQKISKRSKKFRIGSPKLMTMKIYTSRIIWIGLFLSAFCQS